MLIIPIIGKLKWSNPPLVTIGLILINCFIFFVFQSDDTRKSLEAQNFYVDSGLAEIEVPAYIAYLEKTKNIHFSSKPDEKHLSAYHHKIENDFHFLIKLRQNEIITPQHPQCQEWKELRRQYEEKLSKSVTISYGFRPAYKEQRTWITYMFLHGGFSHLLGNMVFLWLVGCMLEMGVGCLFCATAYLITGVSAVFLFWLFNMQSTIPLVGASGAIAGYMGALTVIFGKSRVRIFYSLGFYFNYIRIPAILLLPLWIGNELIQMYLGDKSNIAYMAHVGGLVGGAVFGLFALKMVRTVDKEVLAEEPSDEISPLIEAALQRLGELDLEGARGLLEQVLEKSPDNTDALKYLFNVDKQQPENDRFHYTAKQLLLHLCQTKANYSEVYDIFREYTGIVRPRLAPALYIRLSTVFALSGHIPDAQKMLMMLMKKTPHEPGIPPALLKLANVYRNKGMKDEWEKCRDLLCSSYPDSSEARIMRNSGR